MSSLLRRIQRKAQRQRPDYEPAAQPVHLRPDGGYATLRPTRGWIIFSAARLTAQRVMAVLLDHDLPERQRRSRPDVPAGINSRTGQPHADRREKARRARPRP